MNLNILDELSSRFDRNVSNLNNANGLLEKLLYYIQNKNFPNREATFDCYVPEIEAQLKYNRALSKTIDGKDLAEIGSYDPNK